jgi:parvulin-like peptidyl-prolyl isomerase
MEFHFMLSTYRNYMLAVVAMVITAHPAWSQVPAPDAVIATQGGVSLTLADVDAFAQRIPAGQRAGFFNSPTRIEGIITNLLTQKQLATEARKAGIDKDPVVIRMVAISTDETLANVEVQRYRESVKVPDMTALAHEQYIGHKQDYVVPGQLSVKHVLVSTKTRTDAEAAAIAAKVEEEAKAHPDRFDDLVEKYSDDPGKASNHGLIEQVGPKSKYAAEFSQAAKALAKPGDVSPVVRSSYGLHVLQLVARTPDAQKSFDDVKVGMLAKLQSDYVDKAVKTHSDTLRNEPMNADPATVASLRERFGVPPEVPTAAAPADVK